MTSSSSEVKWMEVGDSEFHSGCGVFDVTLTSTARSVEEIRFTNFYTATVTVRAKMGIVAGVNDLKPWKTILRNHVLMPNPHCENGSQSHFKISHFRHPLVSVSKLRFIIRQPSPNWKFFSLENVQLSTNRSTSAGSGGEMTHTRWLQQKINEEKTTASSPGGGDEMREGSQLNNDISLHLNKLLVLSNKVANEAEPASLGRFDANGSYDVSMLTYN